jgi:SAM-dependent methyltransferase
MMPASDRSGTPGDGGTDHPAAPATIAPRDGYRIWAATYGENPVTLLDEQASRALTPPVAGLELLDVACGTGRGLPGPGPGAPSRVVGVDFVPQMLAAGAGSRAEGALVAAADLGRLPLAASTFDLVWCRLAIGYVKHLGDVYGELSRVARPDAHLIVTDFHPAALHAGCVRGFQDASGASHVIHSFVHQPAAHVDAARHTGFHLETRLDLFLGPDLRPWFERQGMLSRYEAYRAVPMLLALRFSR